MRILTIFASLSIAAAIALAGCGTEEKSDQEAIDRARAEAVREERARQAARAQNERLRKLEQQQKQLDADRRRLEAEQRKLRQAPSSPAPSSPAPSAPAAPVSRGTSCGGGLSVGPNTSCEFARSVHAEWLGAGGGSVTVFAYSPVTGRTYQMSCTGGAPTVCRGGNNATVYIH